MARLQLQTLTEPMYYILLSLAQPRHGYAVMQDIEARTGGRVRVGAGTLYALLSRFEDEALIRQVEIRDRKKIYQLTPKGRSLLTEEYQRLKRLVADGARVLDEAD